MTSIAPRATSGDDAGGRPLRRDAERNRQRILTAAADVFADRGLDVSLDDIAKHAGLGVGTVYRRFPTKEQLIEARQSLRPIEIGEDQAVGEREVGHGIIAPVLRCSKAGLELGGKPRSGG